MKSIQLHLSAPMFHDSWGWIHNLLGTWQVTVNLQQDGWVRVTDAGGQVGWVPSSFVLIEQMDEAAPAQMQSPSGNLP